MKIGIAFLTLGLVLGFLFHALVFPDFLSNGILFLPKLSPAENSQASQVAPQQNVPIITTITYDGKSFSRTNVTVQRSRYVSISNEDQTELMDLDSNLSTLKTPRPYAYKEVLKARMDKPGTFIVSTKKDPSIRTVITVK